jgi:threonyl-tRNA synthetase
MLICGEKEVKDKSVTIRKLGSEKQETLALDQAIKKIAQKNKFPIN